jgi:hypothetical protein
LYSCYGTTDYVCTASCIRTMFCSRGTFGHALLKRGQIYFLKIWVFSFYQYILPVVLFELETWSLTLREEYRLKVFENRVLRGAYETMRNEMIGDSTKFRNEMIHNLNSTQSTIRMIKSRRK